MLWFRKEERPDWPADEGTAYDAVVARVATSEHVEKQGRSTGRYVLEGARGKQVVYIKKYFRLPQWMRWFSGLELFPGPREAKHLQWAAEHGVPVPEVVFYGADREHACASFLAVEELTGFKPLHEYIPAKLSVCRTREQVRHKHALTRRIAEIARTLHGHNRYHLDFYLCHLFIRLNPGACDGFELAMIDFLRLKHSRRRRWQVKDLGALLFSSDLPGITRSDRLRFYKHYCQGLVADVRHRSLLGRVLRKAARYHRSNAAA